MSPFPHHSFRYPAIVSISAYMTRVISPRDSTSHVIYTLPETRRCYSALECRNFPARVGFEPNSTLKGIVLLLDRRPSMTCPHLLYPPLHGALSGFANVSGYMQASTRWIWVGQFEEAWCTGHYAVHV